MLVGVHILREHKKKKKKKKKKARAEEANL
jgi:hypothetical protein